MGPHRSLGRRIEFRRVTSEVFHCSFFCFLQVLRDGLFGVSLLESSQNMPMHVTEKARRLGSPFGLTPLPLPPLHLVRYERG